MKKQVFRLLLLLMPFWGFAGNSAADHITFDKAVLARAAQITKAQFPDADRVLLKENEFYRYEKSGRWQSSDEQYIKILTEKGGQALRNLSFYFNTHYNRIRVENITIIKPDGKKIKVDVAQNSRSVINASQMASNIYDPASRSLVVTLPRIEIGDVLYLKTCDEHFKPRIPNFWSNYTLLQSTTPILENNITVDAPAELPLRSIAVKDEVRGTVRSSQEKSGDRIIYRWSAKNVPQVLSEPGMPELHTCVQRLLVSTAASWEEVSRWYWQLCRPRLDAVTPAMKKKVGELIRGRKTDMDRIKAIFQFVSQNIRYMGITPEKEAPGYEPHDVKLTFERRYGVCRDKAALLVSLLELAGFKAYPVLFMAGDPKDDEIPNGYFNHAVTAVELGKDNYVLMDPTYESTTDLFPAFQADMSCLVAHPKGSKLRRSPLVSSRLNRTVIRTKARIDAGNTLRGESHIRLTGVNDVYYRGALSRWPAESRKRFFTGRIQRVIPGAVLEELTVIPENIRDMGRNLEFKFRFSAPISAGTSVQLLVLPEFSEVFGIGEAVFHDVALLKRKYPLKLVSTFSSDEECLMSLPETCRMQALPQPENVRIGKKISFSRSAQLSNNVLNLQRKMDVNTLELSAREYPELKKLLNTLENAATVLPVSTKDYQLHSVAASLKVFPGANSVIEKHDVFVNITDLSRWSIRSQCRRKILNYAGVKEHSEIKIPFVAGWVEPGKVEASVIAPDGKVRRISSGEINIMDAPRNSAAPRYPAGKIMVISLPGVVPGSTVVTDITRNFMNRPFFSAQFCFSSLSAPVVKASLTVAAPDKIYLKSSVTGEHTPRFEEQLENGKMLKKWQFTHLPRVKNEAGQPAWQLFRAGVLLSSGNNRNYCGKLLEQLNGKVQSSLAAAEKLIRAQKWRNIKNKEQQLIAVRDYVDKFVRKAPVSLRDIPLTALSNAEMTLSSGYGNSADRAILLGAILKALKIEYQFVGSSDIGAAPQVSRLFNHNPDPERMTEEILLYLPDLQWYLNDTGRYASPGSVNSENKLGMELSSGRLMMIQSAPMKNTSRQFAFHIECMADDSALIRVTETLSGANYENVKEFLMNATPERRRRFFEERASAVSHAGILQGEPESSLKTYPGVLNYRIKARDFVIRSGVYRFIKLPHYDLLRRINALPVSDKRSTPYWRNSTTRLGLRYTIQLPPGFEVVPGRKEKIQEGKYGSAQFSETCSAFSGQISLQSRLYLPVELVSVLDFCELENRKLRVSQPEADRIVFKQISGNSGKKFKGLL